VKVSKPTLAELYNFFKWAVRERKLKCVCCGKTLTKFNPAWYEHPDGLVGSDGKKYWLYLTCTHCGYQNAWWKLLKQLERENSGH